MLLDFNFVDTENTHLNKSHMTPTYNKQCSGDEEKNEDKIQYCIGTLLSLMRKSFRLCQHSSDI